MPQRLRDPAKSSKWVLWLRLHHRSALGLTSASQGPLVKRKCRHVLWDAVVWFQPTENDWQVFWRFFWLSPSRFLDNCNCRIFTGHFIPSKYSNYLLIVGFGQEKVQKSHHGIQLPARSNGRKVRKSKVWTARHLVPSWTDLHFLVFNVLEALWAVHHYPEHVAHKRSGLLCLGWYWSLLNMIQSVRCSNLILSPAEVGLQHSTKTVLLVDQANDIL